MVNALLDDASTKTYINTDVANELGLKGKTEQVTVNVLNRQLETFELESVNGNVKMKVSAYKANRVTGNIIVVEWNRYKAQWPHLKNINFQQSPTRPIVDILFGLDCAELHYAFEEFRGRPGLLYLDGHVSETLILCIQMYYKQTLHTPTLLKTYQELGCRAKILRSSGKEKAPAHRLNHLSSSQKSSWL